jgi:hypothetical protein
MARQRRSFEIDDPKTIFYQAEAFSKSSVFINNKGFEYIHKNSPISSNIVAAEKINKAFTFELYLKCLMAIESGRYIEGHNLLDLFKNLSQATQDKIIQNHNEGIIYSNVHYILHGFDAEDNFLEILKSIANTFIDLRYIFEEHNQNNYDFGFTMKFVRGMILQLRPDFKIQDV